MGTRGLIGDRLRERLRNERLRRGWSQAHIAELLSHNAGDGVIATTVAKIEAGDREVRVIELYAYAELFGISVDTLLGARGNGTDALLAAERLSSNACKMASDVFSLREKLDVDILALEDCAERDRRFDTMADLYSAANLARARLEDARTALTEVGGEFPLPGKK